MRFALLRYLPLALLLLALSAAPAAATSEAQQVINECYKYPGPLTHHYSTTALQQALENLPADVREYSDCPDVIQHQLYVQEGKIKATGGGGGSGGSGLPTVLIAVIVVLLLAAATLGALAVRRRRTG